MIVKFLRMSAILASTMLSSCGTGDHSVSIDPLPPAMAKYPTPPRVAPAKPPMATSVPSDDATMLSSSDTPLKELKIPAALALDEYDRTLIREAEGKTIDQNLPHAIWENVGTSHHGEIVSTNTLGTVCRSWTLTIVSDDLQGSVTRHACRLGNNTWNMPD